MSSEFRMLARFRDKLAPSETTNPVTAAFLQAHGPTAPEQLVELWRLDGLTSYDDGLFGLVDPSDYSSILDRHFPEFDGNGRVFLRAAFGYMFVYNTNSMEIVGINCHIGEQIVISPSIPFLGMLFSDEGYLNEVHWRDTFHDARDRLGAITPDQCFAFVPTLSLGGSGSAETVEIGSSPVHFDFLLQLSLT